MLAVSDACLRELGWPHIADALARSCTTEPAALCARRVRPSGDPDAIRRTASQVGELRTLLDRGEPLPLDGLHDLRRTVARCRRGGVASAAELLRVAETAGALARAARHLRGRAEELPSLLEPDDEATDDGDAPRPATGGVRDLSLGPVALAERLEAHARPEVEAEAEAAETDGDATARAPSLEPLERRAEPGRLKLPQPELLAQELAETFDEAGGVRPEASPELEAAHRELSSRRQEIRERLDRFLERPDVRELCQEAYYTERDGRYVVPVIASFQAHVPGIVHGASNTANTVYIEPREFIDANNALALAEARVEDAVQRVLAERSQWVADEADELLDGLAAGVALDLLQARAAFGRRWHAELPALTEGGSLELRRIRNPHLLLRFGTPAEATGPAPEDADEPAAPEAGEPGDSEVVPNDVVLRDGKAFVVITGPNAGGKTVTLNSVGLSVLMTHASVPVPAASGSRVPHVRSLHTIVGDAQDIQRDLSTFSGHVLELRRILEQAGPETLVLLDEIIVGTEPERGAALAIAVLEALADRGARGFVTTHYERLKTLGYEDERFDNASVGIDPDTLQPTYELRMGAPGASSPFEVAEQLGLDASIVERARAISVGHGGLAESLDRLETARREQEEARSEAEAARRRAEEEAQRLEAERDRLRRRADEEATRMREEVLAESRRTLEALRERVRAIQRESDPRALEAHRREVEAVREEAEQALEAQPSGAPEGPSDASPDAGDFEGHPAPGTQVWVRPLGRRGEIVEQRGNDELVVAVGGREDGASGMHMTLARNRLGRLREPTAGPRRGEATPSPAPGPAADGGGAREAEERMPPPRTPESTLDLRGMRRDEAMDRTESQLDEAFRASREALWIIHGRGTGALRDAVRELLASDLPYVETWRGGLPDEGGDGVTIVWLTQR